MSDHEQFSATSPEPAQGDGQRESNTLDSGASSKSSSAAPKHQKSGLSRAIQSLLSAPQSRSGAGVAAGGNTFSLSRGRAPRSPVEPLVSSPLRISSTMASVPSSPERAKADVEDLPRRSQDQLPNEADRPASTEHPVGVEESPKSDLTSPALVQPASKKLREKSQGRSAMAAVMSGLELRLLPKSFTRGRESGRDTSRRGSSLDARSSSASRLGRSVSPGSSLPSSSSNPSPILPEKEKAINMNDALNKSDDALAERVTNLPDYVKPSEEEHSGERLAKDVFDRDKNIIESSDDEDPGSSSEDEASLDGDGKKKAEDPRVITPDHFNPPKDDKSPEAPEEELKSVEKPNDSPEEKKPRKSALKAVVHPQTSFDIPTPTTQSAVNTPYGSEDEAEIDDIRRAQKLRISMSAIDNLVPNRSIRTIVRGDFAGLQEEAAQGRLRQRKYLVATDLSEESVYALEWTIGTILRDGDTMFAIYAIHEDANMTSVQVGEGAKAMQDATAVVGSQTKEATQKFLGRLPGSGAKSGSDPRASPRAEAERVKAVEAVSSTCVKLLRKTLLQVRIAVEVIHCKNPKLMITEAIDELEPKLVIVGARGQSALKGVLLGSFSNYLLSNSSVPVMVARRKLKRHASKGRGRANVRLSNNLPTPKSLVHAKVD